MHAIVRLGLVSLAALVVATQLPSCYSEGCGNDLDVELVAEEPGDYVFEGAAFSGWSSSDFRCPYTVRQGAGGVPVVTPGECEGRVGLYAWDGPDGRQFLHADFYDAPGHVTWTLTRTLPMALTAEPEVTSGTLDPAYEGEEGCSHADETVP